jgi:DNA end-binding protein Ku
MVERMATTVWKGHIAFGLISIPVRLYRAARKESVRLHHVRYSPAQTEPEADVEAEEVPLRVASQVGPRAERAQPSFVAADEEPEERPEAPPAVTRLQQRFVEAEAEAPVPPQERAKAFAYGADEYVVVRDEEIRRLRPKTSPDMQILQCVALAEIDPVYFETSYYVTPEPAGERPYALFYASLQKAGYVALAKMAMHGREHIMVVRPGLSGLLAHTMFYSDEVRRESEFAADVGAVAPKELALATEFVRALAAPFEPDQYQDEYRAQLRALIEAKAARTGTASQKRQTAAAAPVVDIMEALKKSLAAARKPVEKAKQATPRRRRA